jgi:biotin transport system substrate-specific component
MIRMTLSHRIWPVAADANLLRNVILVVSGVIITAAAAHISIPLTPVPMTLQTLAVLALGAAYGSSLGALTMVAYAAAGAAGLPVFAPTADGYPGLLGPSAGYVFGFIFSAFVVGWFAERGWDRNAAKLLIPMLLGAAVLYVPGLLWLKGFVGGFDKAVEYGLAPFAVGDTIKAVVAAIGIPTAWNLFGLQKSP